MTPGRRPDYRVGLAAVLLALGCAWTARRSGPFADAPVAPPAAVARGERVFMQHCHRCHPGGAAGLVPGLNDRPLPAALLARQIRQGLGAMPAFPPGVLADDAVSDVVAFLVALRERTPRPEAVTQPKASGTP